MDELRQQLDAAYAANQALTTDNVLLTGSLGRMTAERDRAIAERDEARGQIIAHQQARAQQSRTVDQLKQHFRDALAEVERKHVNDLKGTELHFAGDRKGLEAKVSRLEAELKHAQQGWRDASDAHAEALLLVDELRKMLEKYEPQMQADKVAAELAVIERKEAELAERKAKLKESMQPAA